MEMDPAEDIMLEKPDIELVEQTAVAYDAGEIFATALESQPDIEAAEFSTEVAKANIAIAKGAYYPTLGFGAGYNTSVYSVASRLAGRDANNEPIYERVTFGAQLKENEARKSVVSGKGDTVRVDSG